MWRKAWGVVFALAAGCAEAPLDGDVAADEAAADTGGYDIAPMIFNGATSAEGAVVALVDANGNLVCSGTAVRQDIILTAAHCFDGAAIAEVLEGSSITAPTRRYAVAQTVAHPNYNPATLANDIGAVRLASSFRGPLMGIGLPRSGLGQVPVGSLLRVAGFGFDQNNLAGRRREASVSLTSVQTRVAFASNTAAGGCPGDSGGPLIANVGGRNRAVGILAGIVPPVVPVANACAGDGIYTRVDAYVGWLSTL